MTRIELKTGYGRADRLCATNYKDIARLLQDLNKCGVVLEEDDCVFEVIPFDDPDHKPAGLGFVLLDLFDGKEHWWDFLISCSDLNRTHGALHPLVSEAFRTQTGRGRIARLLEAGVALNQLADRLGETK